MGLEAAVARGVKLGPKYKLDEYDLLEAHRAINQENKTLSQMAKIFHVSPAKLKRGMDRLEIAEV